MPSIINYLTLSLIVFLIGLFGVLTRRNAVGILMGIELMLNAANINFIAFSYYLNPGKPIGQIFALFVIALAAAEACVGLAIILNIYRNKNEINVDDINLMKW